MSNFSDAIDAPVSFSMGGETYTLPVLSMRDYKPWMAELFARQKETAETDVPKTIPGPERERRIKRLKNVPPGPESLLETLFTPDTMERVLKMSMAKGGYEPDKIEAFLDRLPTYEGQLLVYEVAALNARVRVKAAEAPKTEAPKSPEASETGLST